MLDSACARAVEQGCALGSLEVSVGVCACTFPMQVAPCCKQYCHDWWACPFAHEGEKARRRDPRTHNYVAVACPYGKQVSIHEFYSSTDNIRYRCNSRERTPGRAPGVRFAQRIARLRRV